MGLNHNPSANSLYPPPLFLLFLLLFQLLGCMVVAISRGSKVKSLPGYGDLPLTLETGYIGVGEKEEVQLFYYFVKSENNPKEDPVVLWINGGPGCSSLGAFFFENGPLAIDIDNYKGGLPTLLLNEHSWTKGLNIIFLDAPIGTGFSYSKTTQGYNTSDSKSAANTHEFIQKWFKEHPSFLENPLYLSGEGYSGKHIPVVIQRILTSNEAGIKPIINVKGYAMGNPGTDSVIDSNSRIPIAHRLGLVSDDIFEAAYASCNGTFYPAPNTEDCNALLSYINELLCYINPAQILDPACSSKCLTSASTKLNSKSTNSYTSLNNASHKKCDAYYQSICQEWANNVDVQEALHVRQGAISTWLYCNDTLNSVYGRDIESVIAYHQNFSKTNLRGLIYSGDHDTGIPYIGTQQWIKSLNLPMVDKWRPWSVNNETAGYTRKFENGDFSLTYATVKGAGHFAAKFKPQCSAMIARWMAYESL
ncbi:hypothetical protein P3X46_024875 [Hevea brasiliensis]|uniref:Carboxypeptidase n=1 Tax=Hevea brasiliensis TaxID=3981 RepID=A0ABQ9L5C5_HEVBR|nr:serine carboxypeptidase-like 2 [Hevea brasiliensis]KAJ9159366.1 hypothetical protein P3X46_024875 [Hevea brasiliensis]